MFSETSVRYDFFKKKKEVREGQRGEREGRKEGGEKHLGWNNNYLFLKG